METKFTQNNRNNFTAIQLDMKLTDFFREKINLFSNTSLVLILLFLIFNSFSSFGQRSCSADFEVLKGRNIRSTPLDGTFYTMVITNRSSSSSVYSLSARNINRSCVNSDGSSSQNNIDIETAFLDLTKNPITEISIDAGESLKFLLHITVPVGTPINKWCCTQIMANSSCSNYQVSTVLHTLVINPNDE